jgi:hypothetical protein
VRHRSAGKIRRLDHLLERHAIPERQEEIGYIWEIAGSLRDKSDPGAGTSRTQIAIKKINKITVIAACSRSFGGQSVAGFGAFHDSDGRLHACRRFKSLERYAFHICRTAIFSSILRINGPLSFYPSRECLQLERAGLQLTVRDTCRLCAKRCCFQT